PTNRTEDWEATSTHPRVMLTGCIASGLRVIQKLDASGWSDRSLPRELPKTGGTSQPEDFMERKRSADPLRNSLVRCARMSNIREEGLSLRGFLLRGGGPEGGGTVDPEHEKGYRCRRT